MEKLDQIMKSYVADISDKDMRDKIPGAAFVVVDRNGPIYKGSVGRQPSLEPVDARDFGADTHTWVASLTKIITVTCVMQLVEQGSIALDDDVQGLVPELENTRILAGFDGGRALLVENPNPITLRNLLTHTAGMGYDLADADLTAWSHSIGRQVNNLSFTWDGWNTPLRHAPGDGWSYGSGVDWASKLLSKITGRSLGEYMRDSIFEPLDMKNTSFRPQNNYESTGVYRDDAGKLYTAPLPVPVSPPVESGGCGLYTTATDYAKVLAALLKAGSQVEEDGVKLLKKETVDEMFRPQLECRQRSFFQEAISRNRLLIPWAPDSINLDCLNHGITGVINLDDVPGKRREGSMSWLGMNNGHWWIDRKSGIAASLLVNVLPINDQVVKKLYNDLELAVYGELLPSLHRARDSI